MNNKALLTVIAIIALGIFTVLFVQMTEKSPGEQIADDIGKVTEEIGDEIDDNTDARY